MRDVTSSVALFREIARHVWNTSLIHGADWNVRDEFDLICRHLFTAIVLRPLGVDASVPSSADANPKALECLRVVPAIESAIPILVNRSTPRSGYWDDPVRFVKSGEADLKFVRFFDWDELGFRDFRFVEVVIEQFAGKPQVQGRAALIESSHVRVMFELQS